jgi:hypothetical protein
MFDSHTLINLIISVTFVSTFIAIFFFTYASGIERKIVVNQVDYIVEDLFGSLNQFVPEEYKPQLKNILANLEAPQMELADKVVKDSNKELLKTAAKVVGVVFLIGMGSSYYLSNKYGYNFKDILIQNLIILAGVALVEFVFITYIAPQYISGDPNYTRRTILKSLKKL